MKTVVRALLVSFLSLGAARAEDACRADAAKLCAGVRPGEGRVLACLEAKGSQLSAPCKQQVAVAAKAVKEVGDACGDDVQQFCPNVKSGGGRILKCLAANGPTLSQTCQKMVQKAEEKSAEFKKSCGEDVTRFCASVPKGQGRILACLQSKEAELAPACKTMLQPLLSSTAAMAPAGLASTAATAAGMAPAGVPTTAPGAIPAIPAAPAAPAAKPAAPPATPAPPAKK